MLESIRKALLARRHSPEYAEHRLRTERAVARMPEERATRAWRKWLWSLPPQAWSEAIELRSLKPSDPEAEIRGITRHNRALVGSPNAAEEIAAIRAEARRKDAEIEERCRGIRSKMGRTAVVKRAKRSSSRPGSVRSLRTKDSAGRRILFWAEPSGLLDA